MSDSQEQQKFYHGGHRETRKAFRRYPLRPILSKPSSHLLYVELDLSITNPIPRKR